MTPGERERTLRKWLLTYGGMLRRLARAFAFRPADVDDLLQEIALQLWQSLARYDRERRGEKTWVYQVGLRTAMTWKKREEKRRHDPIDAEPAPDDYASATTAAHSDRKAWLYERLADMNLRDRSLLLLHLEGLPYREISEITGLSENHVGVRLSRLRDTLSQQARKGIHELR